jgi:hypothetical protein
MLGLNLTGGHAVLLGTIAQARRRAGLIMTPCSLGQLWDTMTTSGFAAQMAMSLGLMHQHCAARDPDPPGLWVEHRWCMPADVPGDGSTVCIVTWAGVPDDEYLRRDGACGWRRNLG